MGTFLVLILLLVFVIIPLTKAGMTIWRTRQQLKQFYRTMKGGIDPRDARDFEQERARSQSSKKKIDPSMGEYVKFEDIPASDEEPQHKETTNHTQHVEQQIVDVEWEDLP